MIIILGDGAHAKVVQSAWTLPAVIKPWDEKIVEYDILAFGMANPDLKRELVGMHSDFPFSWVHHPSAIIADSVKLRAGTQLMAGTIIQVGCKIGRHVLVNTGAQIDHDCVIGDYCHIAPGAVICGNVTLGEGCVIGAGAVVLQGVKLDAGTIIPAGSLCVGPDDLRRSQRVVCGD